MHLSIQHALIILVCVAGWVALWAKAIKLVGDVSRDDSIQ